MKIIDDGDMIVSADTLSGLFLVTGARLESERPELEPLFLLPPDCVPTQPPMLASPPRPGCHGSYLQEYSS